MSARRRRLDAVVSTLMPRVRLDADVTDRALAISILNALNIDPNTFCIRHWVGEDPVPLIKRSDAYLCEYALCAAGDDAADITADRAASLAAVNS